jgi:hypothetical protein
MLKLKRIFLSLLLFLVTFSAKSQELNCTVNVLSPRIQSSDKRIFTTLQTSIYDFMNNTKWTSDKYKADEKIECSIQIEIIERASDEFKASIQVTSRRPVYNSSYNSPVLNYKDNEYSFRYVEYQTMEFNESGNNPNLIAVLAYYAYTILGFDYDTYAPLGGTPYFTKAQTIVANCTNYPEPGWKAFESQRNRYWLSENIMNPIYRPIRSLYYDFHRKGLDTMVKNRDEATRVINESMEKLRRVQADKPGSVFMKTLFDAKSDEMVNLFTGAAPDIKSNAITILSEVDPANSGKYQKIK